MTPAKLTQHKRSFQDGVQFAWDSTSIGLAQECLRKYYYTMVRGVRPKRQSVHLIFGGIYASALELFYKERANGASIDEATVTTVRFAMEASWDKERNVPVEFSDVKKTRPNLIRTIVWYLDQFADESEDGITTHHLSSGKPAVELSFAIEVSDDIILCGHLDRVVDFGSALYVMDQKTTGGTIGPYYFEQFDLSGQMSLYSWAGKAVLHSPVRGVIIDAAQIAVNFTRFERSITTRTPDQLEEWFQSALWHIKNAQEASRANQFPMNTSSCGNYGGCPFKEICSRSVGVRENFLKSDYAPHNWDPVKAR